jgi:hypothetical protein
MKVSFSLHQWGLFGCGLIILRTLLLWTNTAAQFHSSLLTVESEKARALAPGKVFQSSLIFVNKWITGS